jgi:uncharacterized membrane protein YhiD involved in acid resistance
LQCSDGIGVLAGAGLFAGSVLAAVVMLGDNLGLRSVASHITKLTTRREGGGVRYTATATSEPAKDAEVRRVCSIRSLEATATRGAFKYRRSGTDGRLRAASCGPVGKRRSGD